MLEMNLIVSNCRWGDEGVFGGDARVGMGHALDAVQPLTAEAGEITTPHGNAGDKCHETPFQDFLRSWILLGSNPFSRLTRWVSWSTGNTRPTGR